MRSIPGAVGRIAGTGFVAAALLVSPASAAIVIEQYFSSAPNVYGSPSWNGYVANALNSLENGLGDIGNRTTDPTAYQRLNGYYAPGDVMVTSYNSWMGVANPGAPFGSEYGNRIHAGLHIYGDGLTQFRLEDLTFSMSSSDGPNSLAWAGNFIGYDFNNTTRYGVDWGADNAKGGGDDTIIFGAGSGLLWVDELVYVGVGNAFWPQVPTDGLTGQAALDSVAAYIVANSIAIANTYCIKDQSGAQVCNTASIQLIPEPTGAAILGSGLFGLALLRRRRSALSRNIG